MRPLVHYLIRVLPTAGLISQPFVRRRSFSCVHITFQPCGAAQACFVADDVSNIVKESLDNVLQSKQYDADKVSQWSNECMTNCLKRLLALNKPLKYVVTCSIMQKTGAGLHTAASCFWDNTTDGSRTVRWESKSMYCICSVFGLAT